MTVTLDTVLNALEDQRQIFAEFKRTQEEKNTANFVDVATKLTNINDAMVKQAEKIDRLELAYAEGKTQAAKTNVSAKMKALKDFMLSGDGKAYMNAVNVGTNSAGGYAVPEEIDAEVEKLAIESNVLMQLCDVKNTSAGYHKIIDLKKGTEVVNSVELQIISNTDTGTIAKVSPVWGKLEAKPIISREAIEDMMFNPEEWVTESVLEVMEDTLETELLNGAGTSGATKGLLAYNMADTDDGTRAFQSFQFVKTGVAGGFLPTSVENGTNPVDTFFDVEGKLKSAYLNGACYLMNSATRTAVRKFKDAQARFIWEPKLTLGAPEVLNGYPLYVSHAMPGIADDSLAVAFGNFKRALRVCLIPGTLIIRDEYSKKPNIEYDISKRYGLMVKNSEAIKFIKLAD